MYCVVCVARAYQCVPVLTCSVFQEYIIFFIGSSASSREVIKRYHKKITYVVSLLSQEEAGVKDYIVHQRKLEITSS